MTTDNLKESASVKTSLSPKKEKMTAMQYAIPDKYERIALRSLHDIIVFNQSLEKYMQQMEEDKKGGQSVDEEFYKILAIAKEKYKTVMNGFLEFDEDTQRHKMIIYADAIQDVMTYIHCKKKA